MRLTQLGPSANTGKLRPFFLGDPAHTGLDNITFLDRNHVAAVEDAGATVHTQRNALDSALRVHHRRRRRAHPTSVRFIAGGRDASATLDAASSPASARTRTTTRSRGSTSPTATRRSAA